MDHTPGTDPDHRHFTPAPPGGWLDGEVWPMVRILAQSGVATKRMLLIRWERLPALLGPRWSEVEQKVSHLVQALAHKVVGSGSVCAPFERCSLLLVLPEALAGQGESRIAAVVAQVRRALFGALRRDELVEAWTVRAIDDDGLACDRLAAPESSPELAQAAQHHHSLVLGDTDFSYVPLWEVRSNFVFFYVAEPFWTLPDGSILREEELSEQFASPRQTTALDIEVLGNAIDVLADVMEHDRMARMLIPVHFATLATPSSAGRYLGELRRAAFELAERAYFEIIAIPADAAPKRMADIVASLRGRCQGVCARVGFGFSALETLAQAGVFAVGLGVRGESRPEAAIIADFEDFAARAAASSLATYAHGIHTPSLGVAATCAGIDYIGTDALAATLAGCALDDYVLHPIDLYKRISRKHG
jgi:hypothetical protein